MRHITIVFALIFPSLVFSAGTVVISPTTSAITTTGTMFRADEHFCKGIIIYAQPALAGSETAGIEQTSDDGTTWSATGSGNNITATNQRLLITTAGLYRPIKSATTASVGIYIDKATECTLP